jgi:hypothetical protein
VRRVNPDARRSCTDGANVSDNLLENCSGNFFLHTTPNSAIMSPRLRMGFVNGSFPAGRRRKAAREEFDLTCGLRGRWPQPRLRDPGAPESNPFDEGKIVSLSMLARIKPNEHGVEATADDHQRKGNLRGGSNATAEVLIFVGLTSPLRSRAIPLPVSEDTREVYVGRDQANVPVPGEHVHGGVGNAGSHVLTLRQ